MKSKLVEGRDGSPSRPRSRLGEAILPMVESSGVALVITLLMLSVITFLAIAFLVLSRGQKSSVTTSTDQTTAQLAADTGMERAKAELLAHILASRNDQDYGLMVSTNYINTLGFHDTGAGVNDPTNVSYVYANGLPLNTADLERNLENLFYDPRPPVFIVTNPVTGATDFRFYRDENRNGRDDPNGLQPVTSDDPVNLYYTANAAGQWIPVPSRYPGVIVSNTFVGDPEWIGVLEFPREPHGPDNRFVSRYCYLVVPAGKTLDINHIYNQAVTKTLNVANDGYMRNQGVGTWEINLAAFLADLNTNYWDNSFAPYDYREPLGFPNRGTAFEDALYLLSYRYNFAYNNLLPANQLFPLGGAGAPLANDNIDEYSDGPLMTNTAGIDETFGLARDRTDLAWSGADNPNHYFTTQDLFDRNKTAWHVPSPNFVDRLTQAGTNNDSYDRYTYYRLLAQLGTDTSPGREPAPEPNVQPAMSSVPDQFQINVNYSNAAAYFDNNGVLQSVTYYPDAETNLTAWQPLQFFTIAADRMLRQLHLKDFQGNPITITNIPLYEDPAIWGTNSGLNYYTPAIHRVLQLAANIFDSTTNRNLGNSTITNGFFPSVFRPIFRSRGGVVSIAGYAEVTDLAPLSANWWDLPYASTQSGVWGGVNIYGVPWVIGAKKGLPNFNQLAMQTGIQFTRKLEVTRTNGVENTWQMYLLSITNSVGAAAWNSYTNDWAMGNRPLEIRATNYFSIRLVGQTNPIAHDFIPPEYFTRGTTLATTLNTLNTWRSGQYKYVVPLTNNLVMPGDAYCPDRSLAGYPAPVFALGSNFVKIASAAFLQPPYTGWYAATTNRLVYALIDRSANRILDFVNLDDGGQVIDLSGAILNPQLRYTGGTLSASGDGARPFWDTNAVTGKSALPGVPPGASSEGVNLQYDVNFPGGPGVSGWYAPPNQMDPNNYRQMVAFKDFVFGKKDGAMQTPFNPVFTTNMITSWEANDPLVHYTIPDLTDFWSQQKWNFPPNGLVHHYRPWGGNPQGDGTGTEFLTAVKDPQITPTTGRVSSDSWDFPTNRLPDVGWLGRVHRGTPWQTVYLKSSVVDTNTWARWSGDFSIWWHTNNQGMWPDRFVWSGTTNIPDATFSHPMNDWRLFDIFTTAPNENARLGRLSVNQTNLASWSAVLSGVVVLSNTPSGPVWTNISPAGVYDPNVAFTNLPPLVQIVRGIAATRLNSAATNGPVFPNHEFGYVGDLLSTPQLTYRSDLPGDHSPFLNTTRSRGNFAAPMSDEIMERIPQQILSLLTLSHEPTFVIYSFGQTLRPAENSIVAGGLCTNYQITAESAARAVVRAVPVVVNKAGVTTTNYNLVTEQFNVLPPD